MRCDPVSATFLAAVLFTAASPRDLALVRAQAIVEAAAEFHVLPDHSDLQAPASVRLDELLGVLFQERNAVSDEALVILLDYYLGESSGEDVLHQATVRGKPLLPLLRKYQQLAPPLKLRASSRSFVLPLDIRKEKFKTAIDCIERGEVWGVE